MYVVSSGRLKIQVNDASARYPLVIDPLLTGTVDTQLEINVGFSELGRSVASAGDVNNDGFADVILGASLFDNGEGDEGGAFIFHGSASGVSRASRRPHSASASRK